MTFVSDMAQAQKKLQSGQYKHAFRAAKSAMRKNPRSPFPSNFVGIALAGQGKHREAVIQFKNALKLDAQCHDARKNLAQSLILLNDPESASNVLVKLQKLIPEDALVWTLLAEADNGMGEPEKAEQAASQSIKLDPRQPRAYNARARARDQMGQLDDAIKDYQSALRLNPRDFVALINISMPLARQSRNDEALEAARHAVELAPEHAEAWAQLARQLVSRGDNEEGKEQYRRALKLDPRHSDAFDQLAALQTPEQNQELEKLARAALKKAPQKTELRAGLLFALSKIAEKAGRDAQADSFLTSANSTVAEILPYDAEADTARFEKLLGRFNMPVMKRKTSPDDKPTPVYIVGLPRSGTTLCEAILGAHPNVAPLGERTTPSILLKDAAHESTPFDGERAQSFVARDQQLMAKISPGTVAYVDKMPDNYQFLGFLGTAYPNCRIINLRRDPRDIALSMWRGNFVSPGLAYTCDLQGMANRFNLYAKAMQHWHEILPGFIMDLRYEDMVNDIEGTSRSLASFCGLGWTPGMARPDLSAEQVLTLSATQLRQPVHNRSVGKWRQHEAVLAPFIEGLDPDLWPEIA